MKKLLAILALFAASAHAATLVPIQLLNPTGSTIGQTIVSTGASTAPAWGVVPVLGGGTGVTTSTGTGAVVLGTGPTIATPAITGGTINNTTIGGTTPAAAAFTTIVAGSTITPQSVAGIVGTKVADNAQAGSVGECFTNLTTATSYTSGTQTNAATVTPTAGDYDVSGTVEFVQTGGTTTGFTALVASISTTSGTTNTTVGNRNELQVVAALNSTDDMVTPTVRINVSASTPVYLVGLANFPNGTTTIAGFIRACRRR